MVKKEDGRTHTVIRWHQREGEEKEDQRPPGDSQWRKKEKMQDGSGWPK